MSEVLGKKRVWLSINATFAERRLKIHMENGHHPHPPGIRYAYGKRSPAESVSQARND